MKTAQSLLASLVDTHTFRPLSQHRCYRKFLELLPPRFRQAIAFVTVKNRQLMVALSHPGYKMELNYNQDVLKSLLRTLMEARPDCAFMAADRIVIFHSKYHPMPGGSEKSETVPRYREAADGAFRLPESDPELREAFLRIREHIRRKRGERE
ncbi:MAG TPA: DUF721 domain-containing protein [Nitratifractor salsuginis]|uniref:DUF721 domain-containing protein n=1 Tax=Nitratifractor salsuginis TaxID=269261 RepID=A0A7V2WM05_9BACT|nr:DUF721 domain-containing protein [Nitratifractor salsuginis]